MKEALTKVFRNPAYVLIASIISLAAFVLAMWLPNVRLLFSIITASAATPPEKFSFAISLLKSITTNYRVLSASYTVLISLFLGVYVALAIYHIRSQKRLATGSGVGVLGMVSGVFGVGCAACQTLIITSLLSAVGGAGLLAALPLRGQEFGILAVVLLALAIYLLAKQITRRVC